MSPVLSPELFLTSAHPTAKWARRLDNLQLWISLSVSPWSSVDGLRVAEIERLLSPVTDAGLFGAVYFQRVNRAVSDLESSGVLIANGPDRARRYMLTPEGFASAVLNLTACFADPTVEGAEFELKRLITESQSAMFGLLAGSEMDVGSAMPPFFKEVDAVELLGRPVMSLAVALEAFSVHALVERQTAHVKRLRAAATAHVERARMMLGEHADPRAMREALAQAFGRAASDFSSEMLQLASHIGSGPAVLRSAEANVLRYDHALKYLADLQSFHEKHSIDPRSLGESRVDVKKKRKKSR